MNFYEIIEKKKHGKALTTEEINYWIKGYTDGKIPDYQVSALLMAIWFQGLNSQEGYDLTKAMIESGDRIDLSEIKGTKVDKHSTGGVGDTTTLVLAPMVAALGVPFGKMSGRGLGHTGGTLDKLESVPGFNVNLSIDEFIRITNETGLAVAGQTKNVTPADKKLYALRDSTATVDQVHLIASSILSKKIAVGSDALILDVKVGSGAFMKTKDEAKQLAEILVDLGRKFGRKVMAVITSMEEPLGYAVGNTLEVLEALDVLEGNGPDDLRELSLVLGSKVLVLAGDYPTEEAGRKALEEVLENGKAAEKFLEFLKAQGGKVSSPDDIRALPLSRYRREVTSDVSGTVQNLDALETGEAARVLGAGRETMEDVIDHGAGILLRKKIGDRVARGETLAVLYGKDEHSLDDGEARMKKAFTVGEESCSPPPLILGEVD